MKDYIKDFSIIHRYSHVFMTEEMKDYQIPGRAVPYIACICGNPGRSQEEIAGELKIDKGAVARTMKWLLDETLIKRVQNPEDKRQYMIYPTARLKMIYEVNLKAREKMMGIMREGISGEKLQVFDEVLSMMQRNIVDAVTETRLHEVERLLFEKGKEEFLEMKQEGGDSQE